MSPDKTLLAVLGHFGPVPQYSTTTGQPQAPLVAVAMTRWPG